MSDLLVLVDDVARASLAAMGTSADHMVKHHREHLATGCRCLFGKDGQTAMSAPDGTVLIISEPEAGRYAITGHRPEDYR